MRIDSHIHTTNSIDGKNSIEEYLIKAKELELDVITFTEHYEPSPKEVDKGWLAFSDLDKYDKNYHNIKSNDIKMLYGLEMGLRPSFVEEVETNIKKYDYDFIIGSIHSIKRDAITMEYYKQERHQAFKIYLEEVLKAITMYDNFDVLGHMDYIARYSPYEDSKIHYEEFKDLIDNIFLTLIKKGKGIEINTSGIFSKTKEVNPSYELILKYTELGGKIITIGSDAHNCDRLYSHIDETKMKLKELGIKQLCYFEKRKPIFYDI